MSKEISAAMQTPEIVRELLQSKAYPSYCGQVELIQTHISWLFLTESLVYKVKQPVDMGFLDFTTLEKREHFVREELRLNRRLTPGMYRRVVPIIRAADGGLVIASAEVPAREVVEWALEMDRLPAERMLCELLERGEIDNHSINALADLLARFHREAPTGEGVDPYGTPAAVTALVEQNFEQLQPFVSTAAKPGLMTESLWRFLAESARRFLTTNMDLINSRVEAGRIREGHGDLHSGNICFASGEIQIFDCIEFSQAFRSSDVACDLAFLAMDLDYRGFSGFGRYLVHRYAELASDGGIASLITFYKGYRAIVRAKVACMGSIDPGLDEPERLALGQEAQGYLHLAAGYELPRALILMCGLPASGKSWIGRQLARPLHAAVLQSDVRRKLLAGRALTSHGHEEYGQGLYNPAAKRRTYASLLERALEVLEQDRSVIVDATFSERAFRAPFLRAAERLGLPCFVVHVSASDELTRARLEVRSLDPQEVSDAGLEVYLRAKQCFQAPAEIPPGHLLELASKNNGNPEGPAAALIECMLASLPKQEAR